MIIGGSSGLGLELARGFAGEGHEVIVTGRHDPGLDNAKYQEFNLSQGDLSKKINEFVAQLADIDILVYAAGYYQEGTVTDLSEEEIEEMLNVGGRALIYFVRSVLKKQGKLGELITITSTSQWTPRKLEPIYNYVKAGSGHFSNAIAEDGRVDKVLVVGPAGMKTTFWEGTEGHDLDAMLDPAWVAGEVLRANQDDFRYKYVRVLRQPPRVEEVEKR